MAAASALRWVTITALIAAVATAAVAASLHRRRARRLEWRIRELEASLAAALEKSASERRGRTRAQQALRKVLTEQNSGGFKQVAASAYPMTPIGTIRSCFTTRNGTPRQPLLVPLARACLVFDSGRVPTAALEGFAEYSHCWILYVFHLNTDLDKLWREPSRSKFKAKVRVPRLKGGKMGVLATRSPHRPCPIGLTVAKVEALDGHALLLSGVDLVDSTPVLDIKPYLPYSDSIHGATVPNWVKADNTLAVASVSFSPNFSSSLSSCWKEVARTGSTPVIEHERCVPCRIGPCPGLSMEAWDSTDEEEEQEEEEEEELDFFDALEFLPEQDEVFLSDTPPPPFVETVSTLRRRTVVPIPNDLGLDSPSGRRWKTLLPLEGRGLDSESSTSSFVTSEKKVANGGGDGREEVPAQSGATTPARPSDSEENGAPLQPRRGFLESSVDVVIKSVFFQFSLLIAFVKLSFSVLLFPFFFFLDPFGMLRGASDAAKRRIFRLFEDFLDKIRPFWDGRLIGPQEAVKLLARLAWGCFWSLYVCFILSALLAASALATFLVMRRVVEAPVSMTEELSFDYAKPIPEALVPVTSSYGCLGSGETIDVVGDEFRRLVSPKKKLQLTISLKLPESDYNRKLGVFQVRVELLTSDGKVTSSSRHPCLLRFKSSQIHFVQTFLKSLFLLAGYSDESQVLKLQMKGLTEGTKPTTCIRVSLEQRAEYRDGAGIPEIYAASMKLEPELPLFKRILWNWKITVFVWTTMVVFILLLLAVLVCCRSILTPGARRGGTGPGG